MSARSTTSVFTVGMSSPLSTIVVHTSTSYSWSQNSCTTRSSRFSSSWPCAIATRASGTRRLHVVGDVRDVVHTVVHVEHLALAEQLAPDRLRDGALVELADVGEDRLAILGRRVHEREVADAR